ncbi:MAG: endonuclease/exonuclease/phosphatase family protein [Actinobacteria bacterium]|nr:endonuclease/exonuclease/phosphatase family protein [Actinomycetota bacterium]
MSIKSRLGRTPSVAIAAVLVLGSIVMLSATRAGAHHVARPTENLSPSGQVVIVTINAIQGDGKASLDPRARELARGLRERPLASDGNYYAPDVVIVNESSAIRIAALRDKLNKVFVASAPTAIPLSRYEVFGDPADAKAKFLVNVNSIDESAGAYETWGDDCKSDRLYQMAHLAEQDSGSAFTVAGIHFFKNYREFLLPADCRERNIDRLRLELADEAGPAVVGGDFNRRATTIERECDPTEASTTLPWWNSMTAPGIDGSYSDAVRTWHQSSGLSLADEWSHEGRNQTLLCEGTTTYRRSRIDYLFVNEEAEILEAHSDHPGWAGPTPGTVVCDPLHPYCKYSDHRFVWARVAIPPPPQE